MPNPIMIYSHKVDPQGVMQCLLEIAPDAGVVEKADGSWEIEIWPPALAGGSMIRFGHFPEYYTGNDFPTQMRGMQGYFAQYPRQPSFARILKLIESFRFALHAKFEPDVDLSSNDPRLHFLAAVTRHLDGAIFVSGSLLDARGRPLYGAAGVDPDAVMPAIYKEAPQPSDMPLFQGGTAPNPPSPPVERIAHRAMCLMTMAYRGMLERESRRRLSSATGTGNWSTGSRPSGSPPNWNRPNGIC